MSSVPKVLQGAWRRARIEFADGTVDDTSTVLWLQFPRRMVDVRFEAGRAELRSRNGLSGCSREDLLQLARSDSSSGFTICSPLAMTVNNMRTATAEWFSTGEGDVSFQPFTSFPEPGIVEWNDDGSIMIERAPSGAYIEEWRRVPGTPGASSIVDAEGHTRFTMGPFVVFVEERRAHLDVDRPLEEQILAEENLDRAQALLDCEFTLAERNADGETVVTASTHPWRIGDRLDV